MAAFGRTLTGHKNRECNPIKHFLRQITPQNKLRYYSEKKNLGLGALEFNVGLNS